MSQLIPSNIDPNVTSGTQLADIINGFKDAYRTGNSGSSRPTNLGACGYWIDNSTVGVDGLLKYVFYDGTNDIVLFTINKNTQNIILASSENEFEISRITEDSVGPILSLLKKRVLGGGQVKSGDLIGRIDFQGTDDANVAYVMSRIQSTSINDVTSAEQGSKLSFFVTEDETANLIEKMVLMSDGKLGLGTLAPELTLHIASDDDVTGLKISQTEDSTNPARIVQKKKRQAGSGQVQNLDLVGTQSFVGTDESGAEAELVKIEVKANQDISSTAHGSDYVISTKKKGTTSFEEALKISDGVISFFGTPQLGSNSKTDLLDSTTTRNLITVDGTKFGYFSGEFGIIGRDSAPSVRAQVTRIEGIYNANATSWQFRISTDTMTDTEKVAEFTASNGATLTINYVNQFVSANFVDGFIYSNVRRVAV